MCQAVDRTNYGSRLPYNKEKIPNTTRKLFSAYFAIISQKAELNETRPFSD